MVAVGFDRLDQTIARKDYQTRLACHPFGQRR